MIKTLQKKFVITAMTAITVLILFLLSALNITNVVIGEKEISQRLEIICESEGNPGNLRPKPESIPFSSMMGMPKNEADILMSSNFFVVRFVNDEAVYADISRTSVVTQQEAVKLATDIYSRQLSSGKSGNFRYLMKNTHADNTVIVFLDTSDEWISYLRVLILSAAIGLICWTVMLVFVILLSKRAIRPIAENIEKQKQFVTNAGHEIKTPLAIIQSNIEAMELYNGENKWSRNIREQTIRLSHLMKNLLMLSRMDEKVSQSIPTHFSLSELLTDTLQSFTQLMEMKKIVLKCEIQPDVTVDADKYHMEQLLTILLDNAVKYTNECGEVMICLQKTDKQIEIQFQNTCDSLPDVPPEKLFDRFYRADSARTQKSGGYGIGLSMAQSIAAADSYTIKAQYRQPNSICFMILIKSI